MSELANYNRDLTPVSAIGGTSVFHNSFDVRAVGIIQKALFTLGQSKDDATLALMAAQFVKDCRSDFGSFTIEETQIAVESGLKALQATFISNQTLYSLLVSYRASAARKAAKEAIAHYEPESSPKIDPQDAYNGWRMTTIKQFREFKETGKLAAEFPNHLFDKLEAFGLIKLSPEEKKEIYAKAVDAVIERMRLLRVMPRTFTEKKAATDMINRHEAKCSTKEDCEAFKQEARVIAIKRAYSGLTDLDLPLKKPQ